jgi:hypothetical protein
VNPGTGLTLVDSFKEGHAQSNQRLSSSNTLTGYGSVGTYTITITENTEANDFPGNARPTGSPLFTTFTIYVVETGDGTDTNWDFTGKAANNGYISNIYSDLAITTAGGPNTNIRVQYKVVEGSGRLYVQTGIAPNIRKTSAASTISTSSNAVVYLNPNNSTNKVEASIAGTPARTALFIYGQPDVTIAEGNPQTGIIERRLEDTLVVKVIDGKKRAVSGLPVDFETGAAGAMFIPVPNTTVYVNPAGVLVDGIEAGTVTENATSTSPSAAEDIVVQTDSRGEAKTYFRLGSEVGTQTVTLTAGGYSPSSPGRFSFEAVAATGRGPTLSILSGNNQRTDADGDISEPLVVVVRQDKALKFNEEVTFYTTKGTLIGRNNDDSDNLTAKLVYGTTDWSSLNCLHAKPPAAPPRPRWAHNRRRPE